MSVSTIFWPLLSVAVLEQDNQIVVKVKKKMLRFSFLLRFNLTLDQTAQLSSQISHLAQIGTFLA